MSLIYFTYAENVLRVRRLILKDDNISHVTARADMTSTLVSSIHSERSRRLWPRRHSIREETYWCSIITRGRACIQLTGRSVEIIAIFQACSTAKMYAVRTFKLFAVATVCTATLNSSETRERANRSTQFLLLILSLSNHHGSASRTKIQNEEVLVWCRHAGDCW